MWSSAGPSWLVEHQPLPQPGTIDPAQPVIEYSPPTKWPRANTPINARSTDPSILGTSADSGVGLNLTFNSPPIVNRMDQSRGRSPELRTPTSRPGIHMSATPSPFRSFRLSSFNSPTFSDRVLRLSNCENVFGFRYRDGSIEKTFQIGDVTNPYHIEVAGPTKVSRCLQMPSTSDDTSLDRTLPMTMGDGDGYELDAGMADDSGLFGNDVVLHATSTPLPSSPQPYMNCTAIVPIPNPYADICKPTEERLPSEVIRSSPQTPSSFKRAMRDVQRQGILQPRKLLTDNSNVPMLENEATGKKPVPNKTVEDVNEVLKRRRECSVSDVFEVPKKPLKPYSRRWMRLVTGGTRSQREMTAAAHSFIARLPHINKGSC